jgi:hypothetical protein
MTARAALQRLSVGAPDSASFASVAIHGRGGHAVPLGSGADAEARGGRLTEQSPSKER